MAIFRGTTGTGSSDNTIVSAVTEQAGIATTKAGEASASASTATTKASEASTSATTATSRAGEASLFAITAINKATEAHTAKGLAEDAQTAAESARDTALIHANTANSSAVQTVAGSNTQVVGVYNNIANVNTVAGVNTDVTTVAGISSDVTTVAADTSDIGTVSTNIANVNNVGNNIANVNAVHGNASNINTVAADGTDIGTVATSISDVNTVAGISSDVTTVAGLESKMDTVIADASDIGAVAGNIGDVTTVAGINADVDTVAGIAAKVTTVADNISDVQAADTNATNAATSASNASASATSASNSATTATTKATEASNSATASSNSATTATTKASQAAGSATTAGTSASTATTKASEASASATTATTKAGEAASSASAAGGYASTATTKASEASVSATSAESSATDSSNAASTWTNYYSTYLGMADAPPTTDVQGNALQTGAFYYDTGAGSNTVGLYVYNGSTWVYATNYNNVTAPYILAQDLNANGNDIISAGKVGIGTASPDSELHINSSGETEVIIDSGGTSYASKLTFTADNQRSQIIGGYQGGGGGYLAFNTDSTGGSDIERLRIDSSGNVGIGTSSPVSPLHIQGTDNVAVRIKATGENSLSRLLLQNDGRTWTIDNDGANADALTFYDATAVAERMRIDSSGNLGIGTTSPDSKVTVDGNLSFPEMSFKASNQTSRKLTIGMTDSTNHYISAVGSETKLLFKTQDTERMRIASSGNVGIGTTSPAEKLSIQDGDIIVQNDTKATFGFKGTSASTALAFRDRFAGVDRLTIDASGNVGIGTDSPATNLHIAGGSSGTNQALFRTSSGGGGGLQIVCSDLSLANPLWSINTFYGEALAFGDGTNEHMRINSSGNVGIGTDSPQSKLHAKGTGTTAIQVTGGDSNVAGIYLGKTGGLANGRLSYSNADNSLQLFTNNAERMRIDSSGNLLVGTTNTTPFANSANSSSDNGIALRSDGILAVAAYKSTANSGNVVIANRTGTDGSIIGLQKSGSTVGSIGSQSGHLYISSSGANSAGLRLQNNGIISPTTNAVVSGDTVDIGQVGARFKDLHLSGQAYASYLRPTVGSTDFINFSSGAIRLATGGSESARIDTSGNLLVGTTDQYALNGGFTVQTGTVPYINVGHASTVAHGNYYAAFRHGNNTIGTITQNGTTSVSYNVSSDERLKENITDSADAGSKVDAIRIRQYDWKADGSHQDYGVIAQELLEVAPEAVHQPVDEEDMMGVDYSKLVPMLIKEVQTLRNRVAQLENN